MNKEKFEPKLLGGKIIALESLINGMYANHQYKYEVIFKDTYQRASQIIQSALQLTIDTEDRLAIATAYLEYLRTSSNRFKSLKEVDKIANDAFSKMEIK